MNVKNLVEEAVSIAISWGSDNKKETVDKVMDVLNERHGGGFGITDVLVKVWGDKRLDEKPQHSPLPWAVWRSKARDPYIIDANGLTILRLSPGNCGESGEKDLVLTRSAVNSHRVLLELFDALETYFGRYPSQPPTAYNDLLQTMKKVRDILENQK